MRRIAILSDIHSNLDALKLIYKDSMNMNVDKVFHLGDAIGIGPEPKEVIDFILKNDITTLKGNHEMYYLDIVSQGTVNVNPGELEHLLWVAKQLGDKYFGYIDSLDHNILYECEGIRINMCHFPYKLIESEFYRFYGFEVSMCKEIFIEDADIYIYGHLHEGNEFIDESGHRFINLRSSGATWLNETSYLIIEVEDGSYTMDKRIIEYDRSIIGHKLEDKRVPSREFIREAFFDIT